MNLHAIAGPAVATINPTVRGIVRVNHGYITQPGGVRLPQYTETTDVPMQVQALTTRDLQQAYGLNISGSTHAVYLKGNVEGLVRPENKGGDILTFNNQVWLVTGVLEHWPDWTKVAVTLQQDQAQ